MSPLVKRDLCFIAKYFVIGLMISVGIISHVFADKQTQARLQVRAATSVAPVVHTQWEYSKSITPANFQTVDHTPRRATVLQW